MLYLAENSNSDTINFDTINSWININDNMFKNSENGRIISKFNYTISTYIITIAKKISDNRKFLTVDYPNQYSYEKIEWK